MNILVEQFRELVLNSGRMSFKIRDCSICESPLCFLIDRVGNVWFDSNCNCVTYTTPLREASWEELFEHVGSDEELIKTLGKEQNEESDSKESSR